jgi:hypothetical protein
MSIQVPPKIDRTKSGGTFVIMYEIPENIKSKDKLNDE